MAIDKDSNGFTFGFATIMVIVVAVALSSAAMVLKEPQDKNKKEEKMQSILASIAVTVERSQAPSEFQKYVVERVMLDYQGNVVSTKSGEITKGDEEDAFNVDVKKQFRALEAKAKKEEDARYPIYVCDKEGEKYYVVPMAGKGLWGPIWGFLAFQSDMNTVFGAKFDHKTETPGLGAEIVEPFFQDPFVGKQIFDASGKFVSIAVIKGTAKEGDLHGVDGITGGTITSNGVDKMLKNTLAKYESYFKSK